MASSASKSANKQSVLIIGAGPGGLASAVALAKDFEVTVLEKNAYPGGRMGRIEEDGYAFDTGPSILQYPRALREVFAQGGAKLDDYVNLLPVEPYTYLKFWDGSELTLTQELDELNRSLEAMSPGLSQRFARWVREHKEKHEVAYDTFIASPADSALAYFNPIKTAPAAKFAPWQTLHQCLMGYFEDERLTYALSYPAKYLGLHPTNCSSVFSVISYLEYAFGVWHPEGGFRALADGMMQCAQDLGARFELGQAVDRILIDDGVARGVKLLDGRILLADHVICNADFAWANQALIDERWRKKYTNERLHSMKYSCSAFMMYLGLDKRYELPHHSIYLSEHVRRTEQRFLEDAELDLIDPPFYVSNPCATEGSSAPEGHSTLYVLVPCPNGFHYVDWLGDTQKMRALMLDRLALLGFDDVKDHIKFERIYTTKTWQHDYNVFQGAVFNLSHNWSQIGPLRPHCKSEDIDGLYWVGGGTHPGSGLVTIFESAKIAADALKQASQERPSGRLGKLALTAKTFFQRSSA